MDNSNPTPQQASADVPSPVTASANSSTPSVQPSATPSQPAGTSPAPAPDDHKAALKRLVLGNLSILVATIFFGINLPVIKVLIEKSCTSFDVTAWRMIGGCALFWIASIFVKTEKIQKSDWLTILLGGGVGLFLFIFLFNLSLKYGNPIDISIIMTLPPIFVIIMEMLFKHYKVSWLEVVGILVSFAGAIIVILNEHGGHHKDHGEIIGDLIAIGSTVCYAFYLFILERPTHTYHPVSLLRWVFLGAAVPALFLVPGVFHSEMVTHDAGWLPWALLAFVVFCPTFLAYLLVNPAVKMIGSELTSLYQYLLPVFATIVTVIIGLAKLDWIQVLAMGVIIVGMLFTQRAKVKKKDLPPQ